MKFKETVGTDSSGAETVLAPAHAKIEALRDIEPNEEVYISYGEVFWRAKGGMN